MRVLKPCGSMWVNLGDKYATAACLIKGRSARPSVGSIGDSTQLCG
jgi:hypothetical protein